MVFAAMSTQNALKTRIRTRANCVYDLRLIKVSLSWIQVVGLRVNTP